RGVHENVRADQVRDRIEDRGMPDQLVDPGEEDMCARPIARIRSLGREWPPDRPFECLELFAALCRLDAAERGDGRQEAIARVAVHLVWRELHRSSLPSGARSAEARSAIDPLR